jgi:hypothetical protein
MLFPFLCLFFSIVSGRHHATTWLFDRGLVPRAGSIAKLFGGHATQCDMPANLRDAFRGGT